MFNILWLCINISYGSEERSTEGTTSPWGRSTPSLVLMMMQETRQLHGGWERTSHGSPTALRRGDFRTFRVDLGVSQDTRCSFTRFEKAQGSVAASYKESAILCMFLGCCCNYHCSLNHVMQIGWEGRREKRQRGKLRSKRQYFWMVTHSLPDWSSWNSQLFLIKRLKKENFSFNKNKWRKMDLSFPRDTTEITL